MITLFCLLMVFSKQHNPHRLHICSQYLGLLVVDSFCSGELVMVVTGLFWLNSSSYKGFFSKHDSFNKH